jgi:hypothetical protein
MKCLKTFLRLKAAIIVSAVTVSIAPDAQSQLSAYEGFQYSDGSWLNGTTTDGLGGFGWGSGWSTQVGATNTAGGLSYSSLPVLGGASVIGVPGTTTSGTTGRSQRALPVGTTFGSLAASGAGSIWVSFLYQNLGDNNDSKVGFREARLTLMSGATINANGSGNIAGSEILNVGSPNTYAAGFSDTLGMWNGSTFASSGLVTPRGENVGATWFVMRLNLDNTAANDTAYLWLNPSLASEPLVGSALATFSGVNLDAINGIKLQAGNSNASGPNALFKADEIRLGLDWNSMSASVPEPSALALVGIGGLVLVQRLRRK